MTYCLIPEVEDALGLWSYIELIGSRTEEDRLRIQRATGTRMWRSAAGQYVRDALHHLDKVVWHTFSIIRALVRACETSRSGMAQAN